MTQYDLKNGKKITLRQIKGKDYDEVMAYMEKFAHGNGAIWTNQYPGRPKRDKDSSVKLYDSPDAIFIGAWDGSELVGICSLILSKRNHPWNVLTGEFGISLLDDYTGIGIGSKLIQEMEDWARKEKVHRIVGMVKHKNERAIALYKKYGFEIEGMAKEIAFYNDEWQHAYYIAKILP